MDMPSCDVAVIGAGPAGARCARLLAGAGRKVCIFEARSPDRAKLCGGLLNRRAQRFVQELGGLPGEVRVGALTPALEFPALEYHDLDNRIRARYAPGYRNINRGAFDRWLLEQAVNAGAEVVHPVRVTGIETTADRVRLSAGADRVDARCVIDASGGLAFSRRLMSGPGMRRLHAIQGLVELDSPPDAMWGIYLTGYTPFFSWIIPKGGGRFLLGTALTREGIGRLLHDRTGDDGSDAARGGWTLLAPLLKYLERRGHRVRKLDERPGGSVLAWPRGSDELWWGTGRVLAAGEAAGLVSPFSGEGISYALASAEATAYGVISGAYADGMPGLSTRAVQRLWWAGRRAAVGMNPLLRPWGLWLLPLHSGSPLRYLPWRDGLEN